MATAESQTVTAYLPYPVGYELSFDYPSGFIYLPSANKIPLVCYLGNSVEEITPSGEVSYRSAAIIDKYGGATVDDGSFNNSGTLGHPVGTIVARNKISEQQFEVVWDSGWIQRSKVYLPYTFDEVAAAVVTLLDEVDLLNPAATYLTPSFIEVDNNATELRSIHFCYPSEGVANGWPAAGPVGIFNIGFFQNGASTNSLWVTRDTDGNPIIYLGCLINGAPGTAQAINGQIYRGAVNTPQEGDIIPTIYARKSAWWTPYGLASKLYTVFDSTNLKFSDLALTGPVFGPFVAAAGCILEPINPPLIGENIFLPSDIPGYGSAQWLQQSAASLPPAKTTADSTNVTADNTTHTADEY